MYLVFTSPKCGRCEKVKNELKLKNILFKEIDITGSKENLEMARKYGVTLGGTIINDIDGRQILEEDI